MNSIVVETSLARIHAHVKGNSVPQFAILTSWRSSDIDNAANKEAKALARLKQSQTFNQFTKDIRAMDYGFIKLQGKGEEKNEKTGETFVSSEPAAFVPGMSFQNATKLAKKYHQTSYMYAGPETGHRLNAFYTASGERIDLGVFVPRKLGQYWSSLHNGRTFTFGTGG